MAAQLTLDPRFVRRMPSGQPIAPLFTRWPVPTDGWSPDAGNGKSLPFRQVRMATHFKRRQHMTMYTSMLDLISNRVQQPAGVAMEHRWGQRSNVGVQIRLHAATWRAPRRACLRNISASGALLELEPSLPPLKPIDVEIALRSQGRVDFIRIPACVVRQADRGVGVEWCGPLPFAVDQLAAEATDQRGIADYLSRLKPTG